MFINVWLTAIILFLALEAATASLCSIWFAGGALTALIAAACGAGIRLQLLLFVAISSVLFFTLRPMASCYVKRKREKTSLEPFAGRRAVVQEPIDNEAETGSVRLGDETWLARAARDGEKFEKGQAVKIVRVGGAKLFVEEWEKK